jgi:hypothetical protein
MDHASMVISLFGSRFQIKFHRPDLESRTGDMPHYPQAFGKQLM